MPDDVSIVISALSYRLAGIAAMTVVACGCGSADGPPVIHSLSPATGPAGTVVTLTGSGLADVTQVAVGGRSARFTSVSPTTLLVAVPSGASSGPVSVHTTTGQTVTSVRFTIRGEPLPGGGRRAPGETPTIVSLFPTEGRPGTIIHLTIRNISRIRRVTIGGKLTPFASDRGVVSAVVPPGASSTGVTVTAGNGVAAAGFTVTR